MTDAKQLLAFRAQGKYRPESPSLADVQATAEGRAVRSASGKLVHINAKVMRVLVHLIEVGHTIGTSVICSGHHDDGPRGHAGGMAVDVNRIDDRLINSASARALVIEVDKRLHHPGPVFPRQLITGGVGEAFDAEIAGLSIPAGAYSAKELKEHCNHIHVGY